MKFFYDIIVVGGGHAGCEAAMAAANLGSSVLLVSHDMNGFAKMSCNPSIGGIAKGQIVREIDALGGYTGIVTDMSTLQFRMLNRSKGPAMWSPRAQCDKSVFSASWRKILESNCNISIYVDIVTSFVFQDSSISGVVTRTGAVFNSKAVIFTAGTFLSGKLFIGHCSFEGGRIGEFSSYGLTEQLAQVGVPVMRMKTGTPPRIDIKSVDISSAVLQSGDDTPQRFSYLPVLSKAQDGSSQLPCFIFHTDERVHDILKSGFSDSPLFTGVISGKGPRYCPSIEDKLRTFPDKDSHQLFLEPQSLGGRDYYLQGFSSSLPLNVQLDALHAVKGFENAKIFKPGYAVEYDCFDPTSLKSTLESKIIDNLFFAGQVNGTTGYEEAAAQGLIAGINAHQKICGLLPFILKRNEAYIGVLIDDLVTKGVDEPYRMFTSRAEYRILLRQDNADFRLTSKSHEIGLASEERFELTRKKYEAVFSLISFVEKTNIRAEKVNPYLESLSSSTVSESKKLSDLLSRPEVHLEEILNFVPRGTKEKLFVSLFSDFQNTSLPPSVLESLEKEVFEAAEIAVKYRGYIEREERIADKISKLEHLAIPDSFDYDKVSGLSIECRQKLKRYAPSTIAQASRIPGVSPSDISVLLVYFKR